MNDKPSWREIDARRDGRSGGTKRQQGPRKEREPDRYKQKQRDKAFDSLFTDTNRESALDKIRNQVGREPFVDTVDAYIEEYGMPEAYDVLQLILEEHTSSTLQAQTLELMDEQVDAQAEATQQVFKSRVKLLRMTSREPNIKKTATRIAKRRKY